MLRARVLILLVMLCGLCVSLYAQTSPTAANQIIENGAVESGKVESDPPMTDIHDIKPPEKFGINPAFLYYALYGLLGVLMAASVAAAIYYWKKRGKKEIETLVPVLAPDEAAFRALDELTTLLNSDGKKFYFRISAILRGYIQQRFDIDALEMTTEELLPRVGEMKLETALQKGVRDFIDTSDPIKFAGRFVDKEQMQGHLEFVRKFVDKSTPTQGINEKLSTTERRSH